MILIAGHIKHIISGDRYSFNACKECLRLYGIYDEPRCQFCIKDRIWDMNDASGYYPSRLCQHEKRQKAFYKDLLARRTQLYYGGVYGKVDGNTPASLLLRVEGLEFRKKRNWFSRLLKRAFDLVCKTN